MKSVTVNKMSLVSLTEDQKFDGIVAFQMCEFVISFFGKTIVSILDTKITEDGKQVVIDGDGYIPAGYEVAQ